MEFWGPALVMAFLVAGALALSLLRAHAGRGRNDDSDVALYRDQLAEIDRDQARGVLSAQDAAAVRIEVSRRLLEADRRATGHVQAAAAGKPVWAAALALVVLGSAGGLYWQYGARGYPDLALKDRLAEAEAYRQTRPSQAEALANVGIPQPDPSIPQENLDLVDRLRDALKSRPDDLTGHVMLAQNEARLGRFAGAADAQAQVLRIKGPAATSSDYSDYAELLILAAGGYVSPEAEAALASALDKDGSNEIAAYYSGLMFAQTGRPDRALRFWRALLERSAPEAPWVGAIEAQIEEVAADAGVKYTPRQPVRGPSRADVDAAAALTDDERQAMIESMVAQLSDRLATEGGPPEEWARLINALGVLGRSDEAAMILAEALAQFGDQPQARAILDGAAAAAGVAQ